MNEIRIANYTLFIMLLAAMSVFCISLQSMTQLSNVSAQNTVSHSFIL